MRMISCHLKKNPGFTLVETLLAAAIFLVVATGIYAALAAGQSTWLDTDTSMDLQQSLRFALEKATRELHESGFDKNGIWQVTIGDGTGVNGTDILRFSMPIICHSGDSVIDANGDIAYWGAPLTWGCTSSSCMDADDNCVTRDYKYIRYSLDTNNQLLRQVLDTTTAVVRQDIFARYITNFQVTNSVDQNVVTLQIDAQKKSGTSRVLTMSVTMDVYLRN